MLCDSGMQSSGQCVTPASAPGLRVTGRCSRKQPLQFGLLDERPEAQLQLCAQHEQARLHLPLLKGGQVVDEAQEGGG